MLVRMIRAASVDAKEYLYLPEFIRKAHVPRSIGKGKVRIIGAATFVAKKQVERPALPGDIKDVDLLGGRSVETGRRQQAEHGLNGDEVLILAGCDEVDGYFLRGPPSRRDAVAFRYKIVRRIHEVRMQLTPGGEPQLRFFGRQPIERRSPDIAREIAENGARQDVLGRK